jgi:hypothetical protein
MNKLFIIFLVLLLSACNQVKTTELEEKKYWHELRKKYVPLRSSAIIKHIKRHPGLKEKR